MHETPYQRALDAEVGKRAREAGNIAEVRAIHEGLTATAARAAGDTVTGQTARRLLAQVAFGEALPGALRSSMLRLARTDDTPGHDTPPPVMHSSNGPVTVTVPHVFGPGRGPANECTKCGVFEAGPAAALTCPGWNPAG